MSIDLVELADGAGIEDPMRAEFLLLGDALRPVGDFTPSRVAQIVIDRIRRGAVTSPKMLAVFASLLQRDDAAFDKEIIAFLGDSTMTVQALATMIAVRHFGVQGEEPPVVDERALAAALQLLDPVRHKAQSAPVPGYPELTLRDLANALVLIAFRNGFLERLHAVGRISDPEMRKLMVESSAELAHLLYLFLERPVEFADTLAWASRYTEKWERSAVHVELTDTELPTCTGCDRSINRNWDYCPFCGIEQRAAT